MGKHILPNISTGNAFRLNPQKQKMYDCDEE